ncbi:MAG TPA: branched-chain amino acid ABC transporter substrate-binding protein [Solirubrobacteraceae bacterium]|nr:branched-chain amino acid ABC transporter substrate-binding protein [Solirubrobacteraceae bacterium]
MARVHRRRLAALAAPVLALALAGGAAVVAGGCGGAASGAASSPGDQLTVYSSLPLQGPTASSSQQIVNGEKLALYDTQGHVGPFEINYVSLDDSSPSSGLWEPAATASNAKTAADDPGTIAYLGEYSSAATAVSLPLINAAGILQISPSSPYGGLTSSLYAGQDEPERFYPTGKRNFARLTPGDEKQALAQIELMHGLRVRKVYVLDDEDPFLTTLAEMVVADAQSAGIQVVGHDSLDMSASTSFSSETAKIAESGAEAVFFAGEPSNGAVSLFGELHNALPDLWLLGPSTLAEASFTQQLDNRAASKTLLTTSVLPASSYPAAAQGVLAAYHRHFGGTPEAYALFGFEAMSATLQAIRRAGVRGNDRQAVIDALFARGSHASVIGRYAIEPDGETTLASFGVDRVSGGEPVFWKSLSVG